MFLIIVIVLLLYTGVQLQAMFPAAPALAWVTAILVFWLMLGWQFLYRRHSDALESRWFPWVAWPGSFVFGVWATFFMFSLPVDLAAGVMKLAGRSVAFLPLALQMALVAATAATAVGLWQTLRGPVLKFVDVPIENLAYGLRGLKIVQISDLHVGPTIRRRYVERTVRRALAQAPDLIAVTGDLADGHPERLRDEIEPLASLTAPLGVWFVTGNHEYYWVAERWIETVTKLGCKPLLGRWTLLNHRGARLLVGGVADAMASSRGGVLDDVRQAAGIGTAADLRLLLAHRPDVCDVAAAAGFDLQLSGHTHGGQFFPFSLVVRLAHRYHRGLARVGRMWLYVSAGTGYWGPPHRFWVSSEITVLTLKDSRG